MQSAKPDARWRDAILLTISLWLFVLLMFLPVIIFDRYSTNDWLSIALDSATILFSMVLGLGTFAVFRATIDWPIPFRLVVLGATAFAAASAQTIYDSSYMQWIAGNFIAAWQTVKFTGAYDRIFRYLLVFAVNIALFQLATSRRSTRRGERQLSDARSAAQLAQLQALRYQINPHFLFNTLNSISALVVTRRNDDAEEMTSKLSNFLRSSLAYDPGGLVPLDEELVLIEEYLDIEAVRFGERLKTHIDCSGEACAKLIPSFLIQPLVENAIKHGVAPSRKPVTIGILGRCEGDELKIVIENHRPEVDNHIAIGAGVGLVNIRQRLAAVYGANASLTTETVGDKFRAIISIKGAKSAD